MSDELTELQADDGTRYPLLFPLSVAVQKLGESCRTHLPPHIDSASFTVAGATTPRALADFTAAFHRIVQTHVRKPLHLQSPEDEAVNRVIEPLIDWERFRQLNPVEQPLWGLIVRWLPDGGAAIRWFIGPHDQQGDGTLAPGDVCEALRRFPENTWFYGGGKVFPTHVCWTVLPQQVPDPADRAAAAEAWDRIPVKVMSDCDAWPLRQGR